MKTTNKIVEELIHVSSETGRLQKVLIHRPDEGIEKVTPSRAVDLLYEDIVYLPKMKEEHDVFTEALSIFTGKNNIIDAQDLLTDILEIPETRNSLLAISSKIEKIGEKTLREISDLSSVELARILISGSIGDKTIFNPLPNLIFTRDIGVVINDYLLIGLAHKEARKRESLLSFFIFTHHPLFKELYQGKKIIDLSNQGETLLKGQENLSIEGGDIMVFDKNHLIMASSERTSPLALQRVKEILFSNNVVERITMVDLPKNRYCMHLDTVFTKISRNECVCFEPIIRRDHKMSATQYSRDGKAEVFSSLSALLLNDYPDMEFIECGEGISPFDEREQWTDGCNLVAVKDGVCFTYDRNIKTNTALEESGYKLVKATDLIEDFKKGIITAESVQKTIITLPSSELSRARGGPHCMTMPLIRD
jgi:arginine deiminase